MFSAYISRRTYQWPLSFSKLRAILSQRAIVKRKKSSAFLTKEDRLSLCFQSLLFSSSFSSGSSVAVSACSRLPNKPLTLAISLPRKPFSISPSSIVKFLVVMLCSGPKASATTVHARQITLYGMEKSGVGKLTSSDSV